MTVTTPPQPNYERDVLYKPLVKLIFEKESLTSGGYNAFNLGGKTGSQPYGSGDSSKVMLGGRVQPLTERTVGEVKRLWKNSLIPGTKNWIHAAGANQIIGSTGLALLSGKYGDLGIKDTDLFDSNTQWKMGKALIDGRLGGSVQGFRNEWVGLEKVPTAELQKAINQVRSNLANFNAKTPAAQIDKKFSHRDPSYMKKLKIPTLTKTKKNTFGLGNVLKILGKQFGDQSQARDPSIPKDWPSRHDANPQNKTNLMKIPRPGGKFELWPKA